MNYVTDETDKRAREETNQNINFLLSAPYSIICSPTKNSSGEKMTQTLIQKPVMDEIKNLAGAADATASAPEAAPAPAEAEEKLENAVAAEAPETSAPEPEVKEAPAEEAPAAEETPAVEAPAEPVTETEEFFGDEEDEDYSFAEDLKKASEFQESFPEKGSLNEVFLDETSGKESDAPTQS